MAPRQSWFGVQPNLDRILASLTGPPDAAAKQRAEEARLRADAARHGVSEQSRTSEESGTESRVAGVRSTPQMARAPKPHGAPVPKVEKIVDRIASSAQEFGDWLDRSPKAKSIGGEMARNVGAVAGVARGGIHAAEGLIESAEFLRRYVTPLDWILSPPGQSAPEQLIATGLAASQYLKERIEKPQKILADVETGAQKMLVDLDPEATPVAPTLSEELRRNFDIGQNQGELVFDIGTFAIGGPWAKSVKNVGRLSKAESYEQAVTAGLSHQAAEYMSQPYPQSGMGHHFFPRRTKLPAILGGGPLPVAFLDSPFNQLKPNGTRWEFFKLHAGVDPHLHGGRLPNGFKEKGWSRRKLGFERYNLAGRIWHGAPAPLKARIGGLGATTGSLLHSEPGEGR